MTTFVAIYRGETVAGAKLLAVSADADLVASVSARLLKAQTGQQIDPVLASLEKGRRSALRLVNAEAENEIQTEKGAVR